MATKKKNEYALLSDEPIRESMRTDNLRFDKTAEVLARAALHTEDPITIGIFGKWGSGKTSLMRMMMDIIAKEGQGENTAVPVWFNAWQYEREEHLIIPLIATIAGDIKNKQREWSDIKDKNDKIKKGLEILKDGGDEIHKALRAVLYGISVKGKLGVPGFGEMEISASMQEMIKRYEALTQDTLMARSLYFDSFNNLRELSQKNRNKNPKIVVFIDDLDRCFPERAVKLIESIKLILHLPGFAFVLGIYPQIIVDFILNKYAKEYHQNKSGGKDPTMDRQREDYLEYFKDYLNKIVQVRCRVPERKPGQMEEYIESLLDEIGVKSEFLQEGIEQSQLYKQIAEAGERNPREIVRKLNGLIVTLRIRKEENPEGKYSLLALLINEMTGDPEYKPFRTYLNLPHGDEGSTVGEYLAELFDTMTEKESGDHIQSMQVLKTKAEEMKLHAMGIIVTTLEQNEFLCNVLKTKAGKNWLRDRELRETASVGEEEEETPGERSAMTQKERDRIINDIKEGIVHIPGGTFLMGDGEDDDNPVHEVILDDFHISSTPVTQEQYEAVTGTNPSHFKGPKRPVESVSWDDAKVFCDILSQKTGNNYDLPTEAQWEYSCRGGKLYEYGTDDGTLDKSKANYNESNIGQTSNVRNYPANPFGLYDMSGNVWEWCNDWYEKNYYPTSPRNNPTGPSNGSYRVKRGGSWSNNAGGCRSAYRGGNDPADTGKYIGFRMVRRP